jgi:hypothetical protein
MRRGSCRISVATQRKRTMRCEMDPKRGKAMEVGRMVARGEPKCIGPGRHSGTWVER